MLHIKATENRPYILEIRIAEVVLISHISMFLLQSKHRGVAISGTALFRLQSVVPGAPGDGIAG